MGKNDDQRGSSEIDKNPWLGVIRKHDREFFSVSNLRSSRDDYFRGGKMENFMKKNWR